MVKQLLASWLGQWATAISTALAVVVTFSTVVAVVTEQKRAWWFVLGVALLYIPVGSLLRAAAATRNPLWIEVEPAMLWRISRHAFGVAGSLATAGAVVGALLGLAIAGPRGTTPGSALDSIGRWITGGTALGAVVGVLIMPRLAWLRRRELRAISQKEKAHGTR